MRIESVEQDLAVVDHNEKPPSSVSNPQTTNVGMVPCRRRHEFGRSIPALNAGSSISESVCGPAEWRNLDMGQLSATPQVDLQVRE
ncbi:hypothetical protein [Dactylosporangium maewongense]|uniref:hypothetical protein n=1 Tax=Dactylosporangium TaxID=35753 RepID=UPI0031CF4D07